MYFCSSLFDLWFSLQELNWDEDNTLYGSGENLLETTTSKVKMWSNKHNLSLFLFCSAAEYQLLTSVSYVSGEEWWTGRDLQKVSKTSSSIGRYRGDQDFFFFVRLCVWLFMIEISVEALV